MSFEVVCGSCHEKILVEQAGTIVICPYCQTALQIPAVPTSPPTAPPGPGEELSASREPATQDKTPSPVAEVTETMKATSSESPQSGLGSGETISPSGMTGSPAPTTTASGDATGSGTFFPGLPGGEEPLSDSGLPLIHTGDSAVAAVAPPEVANASQIPAVVQPEPAVRQPEEVPVPNDEQPAGEVQEASEEQAPSAGQPAISPLEQTAAPPASPVGAEKTDTEPLTPADPITQSATESSLPSTAPAVEISAGQPSAEASVSSEPEQSEPEQQEQQRTGVSSEGQSRESAAAAEETGRKETDREEMAGQMPAADHPASATGEASGHFLPEATAAEEVEEQGEIPFAESAFPAVTDFPDLSQANVGPASPVQATEVSNTQAASSAEDASASPGVMTPPAVRQGGIPRHLFVMLVGYATAVTLALIWLYITRGRQNPLESLPDIAPKQQGYLIPENTTLPYGHTLKLGETGRYGYLEITPLKVTRGPATVVFPDNGDSFRTADPVLKLWLRIRNVSSEQTIQPFGRRLHLMRGHPKGRSREAANTFVCQVDDRSRDGHLVLPYNLRTDMELKDQHLERKLKPGEEYTTYLATAEEGLDQLKGKLVWRVHFRKGYNPESGHGVTTLIDVVFDASEIQNESS